MTTIFRQLAATLTFCLLAISTAHAQDIGIQFAEMPVGTKAYYQSTFNGNWVDVYVGIKRGHYVVRRYKGNSPRGKLLQTRYYDKKGRLVYYNGLYQLKVIYKPFDCDYQFGNCQFGFRMRGAAYTHSGLGANFSQTTVKKGSQFLSSRTRGIHDDQKFGKLFSLGKYNLRKKVQFFDETGMQSIDLVKVD